MVFGALAKRAWYQGPETKESATTPCQKSSPIYDG